MVVGGQIFGFSCIEFWQRVFGLPYETHHTTWSNVFLTMNLVQKKKMNNLKALINFNVQLNSINNLKHFSYYDDIRVVNRITCKISIPPAQVELLPGVNYHTIAIWGVCLTKTRFALQDYCMAKWSQHLRVINSRYRQP